MKHRMVLLLSVLLLVALAGVAGCKSGGDEDKSSAKDDRSIEDKVCDHMFVLAEEDGEKIKDSERDECPTAIRDTFDRCKNRDEVLECYLDLERIRDERQCRELCQRK